ncbi:serine protease [Micromonospora sp. NPDC048170]|uniref:serine protease n=1 Tax=Micromonospora sp. NPDC048170 TaxID=3154819 RepID=UPI0033E16DCC
MARRSAVLLGIITAVCGAAVPAAAAPTYARNEPATAVAMPSTVYLEATYTGYIRDVKAGTLVRRKPVVVTRRCSGVVVNPDGYAVTTSVCVQPSRDVLLVNALYRLGRTLVQENGLAADELDAFVGKLKDSSAFTGERRGTKPSFTLLGQLGTATSGATAAPATPATITKALPAADGNAALVKLRRTGVPAIEIDTAADLRTGTPLVVLGYGLGETTGGSTTYTVRTRAVEIIGRTGTNRIGVDGQIGPDSRGGPVVDATGRLVAVLDTDTSAEGEPIRDLITIANINRVLDQGDVDSRLSEVDRGYRTALSAYFAGRYSQAVRRFDDVLKQAPGHSAAQAYRQRAEERLRLDGDAKENSAEWLLYLLSAAGGALIIGGTSLAQRLLRDRARPAGVTETGDASRGGDEWRQPPQRFTPPEPSPGNRPAPPYTRPSPDNDATVVLSLDDTVVLPLDTTVILPRVETAPEAGRSARKTESPSWAPGERLAGHVDWRGHHDGP